MDPAADVAIPGWPQVSPRILYRRVRLAIWRRPKLAARGDPAITTWSLKNYIAVVTWPGRLRQIHFFFFHSRSPGQMLDTAAPLDQPRLPPGYEQNLWNAA